jgi:hypothetical protein
VIVRNRLWASSNECPVKTARDGRQPQRALNRYHVMLARRCGVAVNRTLGSCRTEGAKL